MAKTKSTPEIIATFPAYGGSDPFLKATYYTEKCSCRIVGNGTNTHPLQIKYCAMHAATEDLLERYIALVIIAKTKQITEPLYMLHKLFGSKHRRKIFRDTAAIKETAAKQNGGKHAR